MFSWECPFTVSVIVAEWIWVLAQTMLLCLTSIRKTLLLTRPHKEISFYIFLGVSKNTKIWACTQTDTQTCGDDAWFFILDWLGELNIHTGRFLKPNPETSNIICVDNTNMHSPTTEMTPLLLLASPHTFDHYKSQLKPPTHINSCMWATHWSWTLLFAFSE